MKKALLFLSLFGLLATTSFAVNDPDRVNIELSTEHPQTGSMGDRSLDASPTAFIENQYITVNYPLSTVSEVVIRYAETGAVAYSAPYDATRQVVINLSSLPEGTYELSLYAFGKWWWGEFVINED